MSEIIIDKEFEFFLPPLDEATFKWLEDSVLEYGCRQPLVLWEGILIDGYNRYRIIMEHDIPYTTVSMEFESRDEVLIWMISNQVSRRNLNPMQLSYFRGMHYNTDKRLVGNRNRTNQHTAGLQLPHSEAIADYERTSKRLAEHYNVSRATIERDGRVALGIVAIGEKSAEAKRSILAGKANISRKKLRELASYTDDKVSEIATKIEEHRFGNDRNTSSKVDRDTDSSNLGNDTSDVHNGDSDDATSNVPFLAEIVTKMANDFHNELSLATNGSDRDLKSALRMSIDMLEMLYQKL